MKTDPRLLFYASQFLDPESRNTIREEDAIEALRLTHANRINHTTRGVGASNAVPKGSPEVRGQV